MHILLGIISLPFLYCLLTLAFSSTFDYFYSKNRFYFPIKSLVRESIFQYQIFLNLPIDLLFKDWNSKNINGDKFVFLLPGYSETRYIFKKISNSLEKTKISYKILRYKPFFGPLESQSNILANEITTLITKNPQVKIYIIGHSMGGLIGRHCLSINNFRNVDSLLMISTPHKGTVFGRIAVGKCAKQMVPNNQFLNSLNKIKPKIRSYNYFSRGDNLISPRDNMLYLENNYELENRPLHNSTVNHDKVREFILDNIING